MSNAIHDVRKNGYRLKIVSEEYPLDPREEYDNLGTMVCWHRSYRLGDKHDYSDPDEFREEINSSNAFILPLYLMDHSGLSISTGAFGCPWDSGQIGYIYVTKETVRKEFKVKRISAELKERVLSNLRAEVETYDDYLTGNVYGFVLQKTELIEISDEPLEDEDISDRDYETIDSCWGFYGSDPNKNGMSEYLSGEYQFLLDLVA